MPVKTGIRDLLQGLMTYALSGFPKFTNKVQRFLDNVLRR
jgi:hypothetical protein